MFNIIKKKNPDEKPHKHQYFYLVAEFFKVFEETVSKFIVDEVKFFRCFQEINDIEISEGCPEFIRIWVDLLKKDEEIDISKFLKLDLHYFYENPITLFKHLKSFLRIGLLYSTYYTMDNPEIYTQSLDGLDKHFNDSMTMEFLNNNYSDMSYHNSQIKGIIPSVKDIDRKVRLFGTDNKNQRRLESKNLKFI